MTASKRGPTATPWTTPIAPYSPEIEVLGAKRQIAGPYDRNEQCAIEIQALPPAIVVNFAFAIGLQNALPLWFRTEQFGFRAIHLAGVQKPEINQYDRYLECR